MTPKQSNTVYQESLKIYWDLKSAMDTYFDEGKAKGRAEEKAETALAMLAAGEPLAKIARYTGLTETDIKWLAKEQGL